MRDPFVEKLNFQSAISWLLAQPPGIPGEPPDDGSAGGRRARLGSPGIRGGCASSRLGQGLKVQLFFRAKKAKIHRFVIIVKLFPIYLAPSGAKYREKVWAASKMCEG